MDWKAMFPNLNVMWIRWSEYMVVKDRGGAEYLVPAPDAVALTYDCAQQPETLVADALELGRRLHEGTPEGNSQCAVFAARHGLLGLNAEVDTTFSEEPDLPPCFRPLNSRDYGEDLGLFQANFLQLYQHFETTRGELPVSQKYSKVMDLSGLLNYRLTSGQTPQLVWEMRSMKSVIQLAYAALVSGPAITLKKCKNCGKVYYNCHAKSEFCEAKCRNYYNVKVFRGKSAGSNGGH